MAPAKPHMNLAVIGHIDHGKSTTVGRILFESGAVAQHILDGFKKEADSKGKGTFEFAWVMDSLKEERERGITIDIAHKKFETPKYNFTVVDCPGHRDFVKNMITGASQADAAIIVVSGTEGPMEQTKEHVFLSKTLGINQIVVAINKMDAVKYSEEKYNEAKDKMTKLIMSVGYKPANTPFIPISAYIGDNIKVASANTPWYKGPTLLAAIDQFTLPAMPTDKPLRLPIQDVYTISGVGTVPVGRVETGILKKGQKISFMPANVFGEVKSIEMHHEEFAEALPGDNVGFNVRGIAKNDVRRGDVCGPADVPPTVADEFTAQIVVLQHPSVLSIGYTPVFHCHTSQTACMFTELNKKLDPRSGQVKEENPAFLKAGDAAICTITPTRPLVLETAKELPQLGRFAVRDMGMTVAAGVVLSIKPKQMR
ncbi:MAG TPA: translation elongation factor EF-1 subunit alpha [Methanocorpusculum sp.]|nr:translation elongation factor EF-1 subunit alpha [Methanocorpusculum sp.]